MAEDNRPPQSTPPALEALRTATSYGLVILAIFCLVVAGLWLLTDFFAAAAYSPNLKAETQLADFDDFGYMSEAIRGYRFSLGVPVVIAAIAALVTAVLLLRRNGEEKPIYLVGGILVIAAVSILTRVFYWPVFLLMLLAFCALYLATEWRRLLPPSDASASGLTPALAGDAVTEVAPAQAIGPDGSDRDDADIEVAAGSADAVPPVDDTEQISTDADTLIGKDSQSVDGADEISSKVSFDGDADSVEITQENPTLADTSEFPALPDSAIAEEEPDPQHELASVEESDEQLSLAFSAVDTNPEIKVDDDYLSEPVIMANDANDIDETLIPVVSDRVDTDRFAAPQFESDTEFLLESSALHSGSSIDEAQQKVPPKAIKPPVRVLDQSDSPPAPKKRRRSRKQSGWRSWTLLDWGILGMIVLLSMGIIALLVAG